MLLGMETSSIQQDIPPEVASPFIVAADDAFADPGTSGEVVDTDWAKELLPDGPPPPPPDAQPGIELQLMPLESGPDANPLAGAFDDVVDTDWAKEFLPDGPPPPPETMAEEAAREHGQIDTFQWDASGVSAPSIAFGGETEPEADPNVLTGAGGTASAAVEDESNPADGKGQADGLRGLGTLPLAASENTGNGAAVLDADPAHFEVGDFADPGSREAADRSMTAGMAQAPTVEAATAAAAGPSSEPMSGAGEVVARLEPTGPAPLDHRPEVVSESASPDLVSDAREEAAPSEPAGEASPDHRPEAVSESASSEPVSDAREGAVPSELAEAEPLDLPPEADSEAHPSTEGLQVAPDVASSMSEQGSSVDVGGDSHAGGASLAKKDAVAPPGTPVPREEAPSAPAQGQDVDAQRVPANADPQAPGEMEAGAVIATETVDTDWAEELLPDGPPPPPEPDATARPDGLRALTEGSSEQRFGFSAEELAILDGLERLAKGIDEESAAEKVRPARMMASVVRLLLRKGLIDERELLDELSRG